MALDPQLIVHYQSTVAYLSGPKEVCVLRFGISDNVKSEVEDKAVMVNIDMTPAKMAISNQSLAVALNNTLQFYSTQLNPKLIDEQEYLSTVKDVALNDRYVAVHLIDGRIKLHTIPCDHNDRLDQDNSLLEQERFFPDPMNPEQITAFTLTPEMFIYANSEMSLTVFCLSNWKVLQIYSFYSSSPLTLPVQKLRSNLNGNKLICIQKISDQTTRRFLCENDNVFLYDIFSNSVTSFSSSDKSTTYQSISSSQRTIWHNGTKFLLDDYGTECANSAVSPKLSFISDAIWDADGRGVILFDNQCYYTYVIMDHTLECEAPLAEFVSSSDKPADYMPLFASQGIVSFQSPQSTVINQMTRVYDDETQVGELQEMAHKLRLDSTKDKTSVELEVIRWKVEYLRSASLIHSLQNCKQICEQMAIEDGQLNFLNEFLWRQLACRAVFLGNLKFARLIYSSYNMSLESKAIELILEDTRRRNLDSKLVVKRRLLGLLGVQDSNDPN